MRHQSSYKLYYQTSNIRHTLVGTKIVDHSAVVLMTNTCNFGVFLQIAPPLEIMGDIHGLSGKIH